jgi:hypothetical protein
MVLASYEQVLLTVSHIVSIQNKWSPKTLYRVECCGSSRPNAHIINDIQASECPVSAQAFHRVRFQGLHLQRAGDRVFETVVFRKAPSQSGRPTLSVKLLRMSFSQTL